jgi:hypothetical protein
MDSSGSGSVQVLGSSEHGNEVTGSKIRGILDYLRDH